MTERTLVVDQMKLSYGGLFDLSELYRLIDSWFFERGWDKRELLNQETNTPHGKDIRFKLFPWKTISDYFKLEIRIKANFNDVKDVEMEKDGQKVKLQQGDIKIIFDGYIYSDHHGNWNKRPFFWFLSILFNKYLFRSNYTRAERWLLSDIDDLYKQIKAFLNVQRHNYPTQPT